ncbi:hypothetical protein DCCM_3085 [Desulfocucumis palustris]|uniref:HTH cro/C1-type domain-containing protein n=1 Tax=Desulfocucumis palustris TaxID=1898651 RepID=A0A2L2XD79_9FIRM|nr:helix-turn-helix transcriptional regulator [Desulfocucumis palustris]GBF33974.1 hypothetical protein DCCM_3085 [Desulfocucumis palustris]
MKNRIAEYRKKAGMSQDQLSKKIGISRPYLSDIERGIKIPGAIIVKKICNILKTNFEALFFTEDVHYSEHILLKTAGRER